MGITSAVHEVNSAFCNDAWFQNQGSGHDYDANVFAYNRTHRAGDETRTFSLQWLNEVWVGLCVQSLSPNVLGNLNTHLHRETRYAGDAAWPCNSPSYTVPVDVWATDILAGGFLNVAWQCSTFPNCHSNDDCWYDQSYGRRYSLIVTRDTVNVTAVWDWAMRYSLRW